MAINQTCDCGCGKAMNSYDAGEIPVALKAKQIELIVRVVSRDGVIPNVKPECLKKLLSDVEILYPPKPPATPAVPVGRVVDPDAAEGAADEADLPMPAAVAEGGE